MSKKILIADDEPTVVALARQKLQEHGYSVEIASNGRDAWNIIKSMPLDLVVLDVVMPVMDGVDVYKEIKKNPRTSNIPIIIITDNRIFRESFQTLGVEHFLPKPLDAEKLLHKIEYVLTCAELDQKNKQVMILGANTDMNNEMAGLLESKGFVVGKTRDAIEFISNTLIMKPCVALIDVLVQGDISSPEVIKALRCFSRLQYTRILIFTQFAPENIDSIEGIEQLREAKNRCLEAGAFKYIGRFTPVIFWEIVGEFFA